TTCIRQDTARSPRLQARPSQTVALPTIDRHRVFADPDFGTGLMFDVDREDPTGAEDDVIDMQVVGVAVIETIEIERLHHKPTGRKVGEFGGDLLFLFQRGVFGAFGTVGEPSRRAAQGRDRLPLRWFADLRGDWFGCWWWCRAGRRVCKRRRRPR